MICVSVAHARCNVASSCCGTFWNKPMHLLGYARKSWSTPAVVPVGSKLSVLCYTCMPCTYTTHDGHHPSPSECNMVSLDFLRLDLEMIQQLCFLPQNIGMWQCIVFNQHCANAPQYKCKQKKALHQWDPVSTQAVMWRHVPIHIKNQYWLLFLTTLLCM